MKKGNVLYELYYTFTTHKYAPSMSYFEYFCWRIVRNRGLSK
jgi:hypothetical protein